MIKIFKHMFARKKKIGIIPSEAARKHALKLLLSDECHEQNRQRAIKKQKEKKTKLKYEKQARWLRRF